MLIGKDLTEKNTENRELLLLLLILLLLLLIVFHQTILKLYFIKKIVLPSASFLKRF